MVDLRLKALELAKEAKEEKTDFEKKARLHSEAAEIFRQIIGEERNFRWNLANHYSIKANIYSHHNEFDKAREFFQKAEEAFLELELPKPAFHCASKRLKTYVYEEKHKNQGILLSSLFLDSKKQLLDKYKEFSDEKEYIWDEHMYWNSMAHIFENERRFNKAAECYEKSAETISKIDKNRSQDEYINQYKCIAIANKYNKNDFEKYINKAIDLAEKKRDEKQKFYFLGLKYDHLTKFTSIIEERIENLKQAKENYYKAGDRASGELTEFILLLNLSQNELIKGNYNEAIDLLNKTIIIGKKVKFPNIVPSLDTLSHDKFRYEGYFYISQGEFDKAAGSWQQWIEKNKEIENTKIYQFFRILGYISNLLGKESFSTKDLSGVENIIEFVRENKLGLTIYGICSLTYSFISLWTHGIKDKEIYKEIKLNIISRISREEIAEELSRRLETQRAIEERDWLLRLPPEFVEKFDSCLYFLSNVLDEYRYTAIREFYVLLEKFLEVIVEFNARILWQERWKLEIEKEVAENKKSFKIFTFGDFVRSLTLFKNNGIEFCKGIPDEIFGLLTKHVKIRNKLTHEFIREFQEFDIVKDTSKIMYGLLCSFPTCIKVTNIRKIPWYDCEILWSQLSKRVSLYSNEKLEKGNYYVEPILEVRDNELRPKIIIRASPLKD